MTYHVDMKKLSDNAENNTAVTLMSNKNTTSVSKQVCQNKLKCGNIDKHSTLSPPEIYSS